jgi:hypothetical protein
MFLRFLREQTFFKEIDKKKYLIFCDGGPHFRANEFIFFCFEELFRENILVLTNFLSS